jgi:hypothetical protein
MLTDAGFARAVSRRHLLQAPYSYQVPSPRRFLSRGRVPQTSQSSLFASSFLASIASETLTDLNSLEARASAAASFKSEDADSINPGMLASSLLLASFACGNLTISHLSTFAASSNQKAHPLSRPFSHVNEVYSLGLETFPPLIPRCRRPTEQHSHGRMDG